MVVVLQKGEEYKFEIGFPGSRMGEVKKKIAFKPLSNRGCFKFDQFVHVEYIINFKQKK